jgi:peptide/nickel transport system substrate-binding protein
MRRKTTLAVATATAALMTLAACGGSGSDNGGNTPGENATFEAGGGAAAGKNPDLEGPMAVPDDASLGGTVTVMTDEAPATLDPTRAYYTDSTAILSGLVLRSLTQYVRDPKSNDMVLVPDMATDLGRPNEDSTEWTFTLKDGLKYEDGSDVKPEDVAYAVKRTFAIAELPDGPTYNTTFFLDGDTYKGPFSDKSDYKGVEVKGKDVIIKMRRPFADMDFYASFPAFTAIPEAKDDPETYGQHPLATGPYKFADYTPGTSLTLVKNENWDPDTDPGRLQAVDGWEFQFGQDTAKLENVIINDNGSAQTSLTYDNVTAASYRQIAEEPDRLTRGTSPCTYFGYIDVTKVKDLKVRQAMGWAFPYEAYWKALGYIKGVTIVPGTSLLPPGTNGRVEYDPLGNGGDKTDPDKAKQLLKEAGAEGFEIKWYYESDDAQSVEAKDQLRKGFEAGGFKATPVASTSETIRTDEADADAPINFRPSGGWCSDWPSGASWFPALFSGSLVGLEGMPNKSQLDVKELDAEQDRILDTLGPEDAAKAWGEFDKTMMTDYYPVVNWGYLGIAMMHGSKVGGMFNDNLRGMPTFNEIYLAK